MKKPRLLLHVCCGPCSTHVIELLRPGFNVTAFFFNPNIHPPREYRLRLAGARRYCAERGVNFVEGAYDPRAWFARAAVLGDEPEGGERCDLCIRMRLEETARIAGGGGFEIIATTLSISPHKDAGRINRAGEEIAARAGVRFHRADFKKGDGFRRSCELSKRHGLYRQDYCGCIYSCLARRKPPARG